MIGIKYINDVKKEISNEFSNASRTKEKTKKLNRYLSELQENLSKITEKGDFDVEEEKKVDYLGLANKLLNE